MCIYKAVLIQISIKTPTGLCYTSYFTHDQDREKQKEFKNVMSFRDMYLHANFINH